MNSRPLISQMLELLQIPEEEAARAILGAFSPCQPGPLRQAWMNRKNYEGDVPSTREIWGLFEEADFKCRECGSQHRITLDHINSNKNDHRLENLQVLCFDCNRAKNEKGVKNKGTNLRVYKAAVSLMARSGRFPDDKEILEAAGLDQLAGATYLVRYLQRRLTGKQRSLRGYLPQNSTPLSTPNTASSQPPQFPLGN